jgi:homoserine dehydrogenase
VLADVFVLSRDILGGLPPTSMSARKLALTSPDAASSGWYLRLDVLDKPGALARIADALGKEKVSIAAIHQDKAAGARAVPVMIATHPASYGQFEKARKAILRQPAVLPRHCAMRLMA